jgi:hypothetical protein
MKWSGKFFGILFLISRFGLAGLFLFAVVAKLYTFGDFKANVSELVGSNLSFFTAATVIAAELIAVGLLLFPKTVRIGALWVSVLLTVFAAYALYHVYVLKGEPLECGCFGRLIASQLGVSTALRNLALLIPAAIIFFGSRRSKKDPSSIEGGNI